MSHRGKFSTLGPGEAGEDRNVRPGNDMEDIDGVGGHPGLYGTVKVAMKISDATKSFESCVVGNALGHKKQFQEHFANTSWLKHLPDSDKEVVVLIRQVFNFTSRWSILHILSNE